MLIHLPRRRHVTLPRHIDFDIFLMFAPCYMLLPIALMLFSLLALRQKALQIRVHALPHTYVTTPFVIATVFSCFRLFYAIFISMPPASVIIICWRYHDTLRLIDIRLSAPFRLCKVISLLPPRRALPLVDAAPCRCLPTPSAPAHAARERYYFDAPRKSSHAAYTRRHGAMPLLLLPSRARLRRLLRFCYCRARVSFFEAPLIIFAILMPPCSSAAFIFFVTFYAIADAIRHFDACLRLSSRRCYMPAIDCCCSPIFRFRDLFMPATLISRYLLPFACCPA